MGNCDRDRDCNRNRRCNCDCNCRDRNRRDRRIKKDRRTRRDKKSDPACSCHMSSCRNNSDGGQSGQQTNKTLQDSEEYIDVIDSCDVTVLTSDTKGALNIQAGLQAALVILVTITIFGGDSSRAEPFTQELIQSAKVQQQSHQQMYIENSSGVTIEMNDTQLSANIQLLLQLLIAVAVDVNIL